MQAAPTLPLSLKPTFFVITKQDDLGDSWPVVSAGPDHCKHGRTTNLHRQHFNQRIYTICGQPDWVECTHYATIPLLLPSFRRYTHPCLRMGKITLMHNETRYANLSWRSTMATFQGNKSQKWMAWGRKQNTVFYEPDDKHLRQLCQTISWKALQHKQILFALKKTIRDHGHPEGFFQREAKNGEILIYLLETKRRTLFAKKNLIGNHHISKSRGAKPPSSVAHVCDTDHYQEPSNSFSAQSTF